MGSLFFGLSLSLLAQHSSKAIEVPAHAAIRHSIRPDRIYGRPSGVLRAQGVRRVPLITPDISVGLFRTPSSAMTRIKPLLLLICALALADALSVTPQVGLSGEEMPWNVSVAVDLTQPLPMSPILHGWVSGSQ